MTRDGLQPLDLEVGKWLRRHATEIKTIVAMNKSESLDDGAGLLTASVGEAHELGFGDAIAISAETGLGMAELYDALRPLLESFMLQVLNGKQIHCSYNIYGNLCLPKLLLYSLNLPNIL